VELALDLGGALFGFWVHGWHLAEARQLYTRLRPLVGSGRSQGRGRVLEGYGAFACEGEESVAAYEQAAIVYRDLGDEKSRWRALQNLGFELVKLDATDQARRAFVECVSIMEAVGNTHGCTLQVLGHLVHEEGDVEEARRLFEEGVAVGLRFSSAPCRSTNLQWMAGLERFERRRAQARSLLERALAAARQLGMRSEESAVIAELAMLERDEGNVERAGELLQHSLAMAQESGERLDEASSVVWWARRLASLEALGGRAERAVRLYAGAHAHARAGFEAWYDFERHAAGHFLGMCRATLSAEAFDRAWHGGAALTVGELRDSVAAPSKDEARSRRVR
jgi:tetratricopeptide (TPR) repeat protein